MCRHQSHQHSAYIIREIGPHSHPSRILRCVAIYNVLGHGLQQLAHSPSLFVYCDREPLSRYLFAIFLWCGRRTFHSSIKIGVCVCACVYSIHGLFRFCFGAFIQHNSALSPDTYLYRKYIGHAITTKCYCIVSDGWAECPFIRIPCYSISNPSAIWMRENTRDADVHARVTQKRFIQFSPEYFDLFV